MSDLERCEPARNFGAWYMWVIYALSLPGCVPGLCAETQPR